MDITLGTYIAQKRLNLKITVREFAKLINKSPQFISDLESDYELPSKDVLERIIQVLDIESNDSKELYYMIVDSKPIQRVPTNIEYQSQNNKKIIVALRVAKDLEATDEEWSDFIRRLQGNDLEGCE